MAPAQGEAPARIGVDDAEAGQGLSLEAGEARGGDCWVTAEQPGDRSDSLEAAAKHVNEVRPDFVAVCADVRCALVGVRQTDRRSRPIRVPTGAHAAPRVRIVAAAVPSAAAEKQLASAYSSMTSECSSGASAAARRSGLVNASA